MEQNVEIVGISDGTSGARALGGVTGIVEFEEFRYSSSEWGFEDLYAGEERSLDRDEVVEVKVFNGLRGGREHWSLIRLRAGRNARLTGPISWRRVPNAGKWSPQPVQVAILMNWIKISVSGAVMGITAYAVCAWLLEGLMSGGMISEVSNAALSLAVIAGASIYLARSWRRMALARKVARIQADGSMFVVGQPEGY
ncbi:hypothetical protein [Roseivivax isoporae]|uniref:Uncharacterized protein n=1 Tax=Roseivivax isoporae LMG 25204 TaxID=1449351 RepID=X7FAP2_9RHOB|nr:hypothetical protein [Roseivivax isoporae]ETX29171.1 hypothetical protein RISW2_02560 [Roseivivax isoporae LMG 25204]